MRWYVGVLSAAVLLGGVGTVAVASGGGSGGHQPVLICHYDRNASGPNAGPHTIEVDDDAVSGHLENHVKVEGYAGDDSTGACPVPTTMPPLRDECPTKTATATATATEVRRKTSTPLPTHTASPTGEPTATYIPQVFVPRSSVRPPDTGNGGCL